MEPTIVIEAYKAGGVVLVLLIAVALLVTHLLRASSAREARMAEALDKCQESHVAIATTSTAALTNNTNALAAIDESTKTLTQVMRERPCFKDPTPPGGAHIPR